MQVRDKEANIDNLINPIEDMYGLLMRYQVAVPKEESDLVSDLHYSWKKLRKLATDVSNTLAKLQVGFKRELIKQVNTFVVEAKTFKFVPVIRIESM
jgi:dynein heavy chain, axonemal